MTPRRLVLALALLGAAAAAAYLWWPGRTQAGSGMQAAAERYVRLVLALGQHDPDYVDAYYGPGDWRTEAERAKVPLADIAEAADDLAGDLDAIAPGAAAPEPTRLRHRYVTAQLAALRARVAILNGAALRFDEESRALYDAVAPARPDAEFLEVLARLDRRLPGSGPLPDRYDAFRARYVVPPARLDATFRAAIDGCRARTRQRIRLPAGERFTVEYVTGKSWSAYNWYQGGFRSVIQVNTDLPVHADRAIALACHEGYPGHHVYNVLLEQALVRDRGWREFTVYPLFSPQSLIAEGTADYGAVLAFPPAERLAFARDVIFPAAGLERSTAAVYFEVADLVESLEYAVVEAARRYLDGELDAEGTVAWLERYALHSRGRAEQRLRFFDQYRSYVINYTTGEDLVARWIEAQGGAAASPERRWQLLGELLASPRLPSSLAP